VLLISLDAPAEERAYGGEYVALVLFAVLGAALLASTTDFVAFFLALQLSSIPLYILAGFVVNDRFATEVAIKYVLLGMVASAIMLYGFSVDFVQNASSTFVGMGGGLDALAPATVVGIVFVLVGFAFKVGAAPMHFWIPDAYQGTTVPVTALLASVPKFAALAALARFASLALEGPVHDWSRLVFAIIAVASMVLGNVLALAQTDLRRLLAYSSIAQVGYVLVALACGTGPDVVAVVLFYAVVYSLTNIGTFAIVAAISGGRRDVPISSLSGLWQRAPLEAAALVFFVLSMFGLPPTPGFWAKLGVVQLAIGSDQRFLATAIVVMSVVSVVYYIRVVRTIFVPEEPVAPAREPESRATETPARVPVPTRLVVLTSFVLAALLAIWPSGLADISALAARAGVGGG
jgi:NADH-quinone oxidoreductase subunit N